MMQKYRKVAVDLVFLWILFGYRSIASKRLHARSAINTIQAVRRSVVMAVHSRYRHLEEMRPILFPLKTPFPCADLKVALGDAEVDGGVAGENGEAFSRFHLVAIVENEGELLLVDSGRG